MWERMMQRQWMSDVGSRLLLLVVVLVLVGLGWWWFYEPVVVLPAGVYAPDEPVQVAVNSVELWVDDEHTILGAAEFSLRAKVLGRERYRRGPESALSPIDLALGWGRMSDQSVVDEIEVSQSGRWAEWSFSGSPPIPVDEIERSMANMHMIPANDAVRDALLAVQTGQIIELEGYLVRVTRADGGTWNSSMSRTDTGGHACEVVWVQSFEIVVAE